MKQAIEHEEKHTPQFSEHPGSFQSVSFCILYLKDKGKHMIFQPACENVCFEKSILWRILPIPLKPTEI